MIVILVTIILALAVLLFYTTAYYRYREESKILEGDLSESKWQAYYGFFSLSVVGFFLIIMFILGLGSDTSVLGMSFGEGGDQLYLLAILGTLGTCLFQFSCPEPKVPKSAQNRSPNWSPKCPN